MPEPLTIRAEALDPLFASWEEPNKHRVRADSGEGAVERKGRRPTGIAIAQLGVAEPDGLLRRLEKAAGDRPGA
jgi:hypothetical protein